MDKTWACGVDLGTMFIVSARDSNDGSGRLYTSIRDCYREVSEDLEESLKEHNTSYIRDGDRLYVLGNDAFNQANLAEFVNGQTGDTSEVLKRPMKDGILNQDSPKTAMMILRELMRSCIEKDIGQARNGEILYFSVPANPVDSTINNIFHAKTTERFLNSLGYESRQLGEGMAVIFSEAPTMTTPDGDEPYSGIGISFGAGCVNFCLAQRGVPIDEFSVARSGDYIDQQAARMTGLPKTRITRIKERDLDFDKIDEDNEAILALDVYYDEMISHVFRCFSERFSKNKGNLDFPIEIVLSGGTASVPGFESKVGKILSKMKDLPFKVGKIRKAKNMLTTVATGCYLRAKFAAQKAKS